jgi:hypothetical protein
VKPFPWSTLLIILASLDLLWTGLYLARKRLVFWLCKRAIGRGHGANVDIFLSSASSQHLIRPEEASAWRKIFGLEDLK